MIINMNRMCSEQPTIIYTTYYDQIQICMYIYISLVPPMILYKLMFMVLLKLTSHNGTESVLDMEWMFWIC